MGHALPHAARLLDLGGRDLTLHAVQLGFGRIVALYYRSSTSYQIH